MMHTSLHSGRQRGFTLLEILIVISIVAIISAITLGGINSISANNKRITCQSNLAQIYRAARLYMQDEGGFPFYNRDFAGLQVNGKTVERNIGLWALYTFPTGTDLSTPDVNGPLNRYVRNPKILHCPADNDDSSVNLIQPNTLSGADEINPNYLSYQKFDDGISAYQSIRTLSAADPSWNRQLSLFTGTPTAASPVNRLPSDDTIVTWCRFHRSGSGGRDFDNVLFYDGSVQLIPRLQTSAADLAQTFECGTSCLKGWERKRRPPQ